MIRLPRTLMGRNALLLAGLIISSQTLTLALFAALVLIPQADRVAGIVAQSIVAVSSTLDEVTPATRAELIAQLNASPYLEVLPGNQPPPVRTDQPSVLERFFMQALVDRLESQTEIAWRVGDGRVVWLDIELGGKPYWIAARAPNAIEPVGALLLSVVAASLLIGLFGLFITRQIDQPLRHLAEAADELNLGHSSQPISVSGPAEIRALASSFNQMTERLAEAESERAFVLAGVSHDLRTPLAKLRLAVEMMPAADELRETAVLQVERMDRLLQQFLDFARGFDAEPERPAELSDLLRACADECGAQGAVRLHDAPDTVLVVRVEALRRAIVNLIENALTHGAPPVEITLKSSAGRITIEIADRGPGLSGDQLETVKVPFRRGGPSMAPAGSGLGLAIAERIVHLHEGTLSLIAREGGGLIARVELPRIVPPHEPVPVGDHTVNPARSADNTRADMPLV